MFYLVYWAIGFILCTGSVVNISSSLWWLPLGLPEQYKALSGHKTLSFFFLSVCISGLETKEDDIWPWASLPLLLWWLHLHMMWYVLDEMAHINSLSHMLSSMTCSRLFKKLPVEKCPCLQGHLHLSCGYDGRLSLSGITVSPSLAVLSTTSALPPQSSGEAS